MKLSDLGNLVKQKYQQYVEYPSEKIGARLVAKYPTYHSTLTDQQEREYLERNGLPAPVPLLHQFTQDRPQIPDTVQRAVQTGTKFSPLGLVDKYNNAVLNKVGSVAGFTPPQDIAQNLAGSFARGMVEAPKNVRIANQKLKNKEELTPEDKKAISEYQFNMVAGAAMPLQSSPGLNIGKTVKPIRSVVDTDPILNTKREISIKDVHGQKAVLPAGEAYTPYLTNDNKVLLKDGDEFLVNKSTYDNVKGQSIKSEAKPFAPELEGLEESVRGESIKGKPASYNEWQQAMDEDGIGAGRTEYKQYLDDFKKGNALASTPPKYSQYTLPGGENYREVLIKAPETKPQLGQAQEIATKHGWYDDIDWNNPNKQNSHGQTGLDQLSDYLSEKGLDKEAQIISDLSDGVYKTVTRSNYKSPHWDEPNVISHIRMNDRVTPDGKKVAFMEELQSDWARDLRTFPEGYEFLGKKKPIPELPIKNWQEPTVKRALKDAVDSDAEYFAWINGDQTSARYNLATYVDDVRWYKSDSYGKNLPDKSIFLTPKNQGQEISISIEKDGTIKRSSQGDWTGKKLDEVLGKGLADKIMGEEKGTLSGEGLKFGGEWANNLYDKQVKSIVEKLTGGKVEVIDLEMQIGTRGDNWQTFQGKPLTTKNIKQGDLISLAGNNGSEGGYIITKDLGNGKFRAADELTLQNDEQAYKKFADRYGEFEITNIKNPTKGDLLFLDLYAENFDIGKNMSPGQQSIRLTPEIKARIRGEAPPIKQPSGMLPNLNQSQLPKRVGLDL